MTSPRVTAGLMWHPDTWPIVWARLATVMPKQRAILTIFAWVQYNIKSVLYIFMVTWSSSWEAGSAWSPPMQLPQPTSTSNRLPTSSARRDLHSRPDTGM